MTADRDREELFRLASGPHGDGLLRAVGACPSRGGVVAPSAACGEANACAAFGRAVTLDDCLWCRADAAGLSGPGAGCPGFDPGAVAAGGRVRVGLLAPCLVDGGAESWMWAVARFADPSLVCVTGLAVTGHASAASPAVLGRFRGAMPVGFGEAAAAALAGACDVLLGWAVLGLDRVLAGVPARPAVVYVAHSPGDDPAVVEWVARTRGVDRWAAVSDLALATVPEPFRAAAPVVPNCVDPARLAPARSRAELRAAWGVPQDAPVAGFLGRLADEKDPSAMLRLAASLPDPWHAVVVGGVGFPSAFTVRDTALDPPRFHAVGPDADAGGVLGAFDVLVVPSLYESFGLALAEALWLGIPVVSTPSGVAKMYPGLTRVVPVGASGPELAAAVLADHADAAGTARRAAVARAFVRKHFAPGAFGRRWTDVLVAAAPVRPPAVPVAEVLARVAACPDRGPVLPVSAQPACGCSELSECRIGNGRTPGAVSLADCYQCVSSRP